MKRNRRRGARLGIAVLRATARGFVVLVAVAAAFVGAGRTLAWARSHPYFALREIDVEARGRIDPKTLVAWAGLAPGMSIWSVHTAEAENRLLGHPRIRDASLARRLPNQVRIRVDERLPVAILLADPPSFVAGDGAVFPALDGEAIEGFPYITGVSATDGGSSEGGKRLREAARLVALWQAHAEWPAISEIRPDGEDFVVYAAGTPLAVRLAPEAQAEDFARLSAILELWRGREAEVATIDLSLPGQGVLKLARHGKPTSSHAARGAGLPRAARTTRTLGKTVI
ncbi:MAG TPA: FtsQ-type POTRA domain-containing protein [Candidatus Binatia bacterium]|nr:FtsQ-type POTRA domain-containing protein [Candidatus Binatia bacterium]